ncbi:hypothetical protein ACF1BN_07855 [Streptomyces sp. NPDC014861]|uniref:hypothetical protein n=1 Tax=Streptomyces sp. NPDC014861 TaxID=3364923 RepID=UPI0036F9AA63
MIAVVPARLEQVESDHAGPTTHGAGLVVRHLAARAESANPVLIQEGHAAACRERRG